MDYIVIYLSMMVGFLLLDGLWLGVLAKDMYRKQLGNLMADKPNFTAAGIFYCLFVFGALMLVVLPAAREDSLQQTLWSGALFGLVSYATYDLTSQAVIKGWPVRITLIDLLWGTAITTTIAALGFWTAQSLLG